MANNMIVKDAGSANVTVKTLDTGANGHVTFHILTDPAGNPGGSIGQGNSAVSFRVVAANDSPDVVSLAIIANAAIDTSDVNIKGPPSAVVPVAVPNCTNSAYSTGQAIGTVMTFNGFSRGNNLKGLLQEVVLQSKSTQSFAADLVIFNSAPANTQSDHAAYSLSNTDFNKISCRVPIASGDWCASNAACFADPTFNPKIVLSDGSGNIYGQLVARGSITLASANDLIVVLKGSPD